ncbi:helix-turn-helix transcriptional regulator [Streptomyces africanus]|uniref:helix-turn-helix transcriptional regulator n=1 Tax=Streptomyces africanus TaxID=231024 RepID=UPI000A3B2FBE|nr:helix-turn-helix transcriptional regulator [Streptomyces africanus]
MDTAPQPIVLTERQRHILWLLSTGHTCADIARKTDGAPGVVRKTCARIYAVMGVATAAQAVRNGLLAGHIGPYEDCGLLAAYRRHLKRDEPICAACKRGNRERMDAEAATRRPVQLAEPHVRLLRAFDAGRTQEQVCKAWGVSHRTVKSLTAEAYAALGVAQLPPPVRREVALREARMRGLLRNQPPPRPSSAQSPVHLSDTQVSILLELEKGASLSQTATRLEMPPGSCASRLSEAYRRLDVAWMDKGTRLPEALRKARALGLLPEAATT